MKKFLIYHELTAKENNPSFAGKTERIWYGKAGVTQPRRSVTEEKDIERLAEEHGFATERTAQNYIDRYKEIFLFDDKLYWHTDALIVIPVELE